MPQEIGDESIDLRHYLWVLRRRWWVVFLGGLLGSMLAAGYLATRPETATATAVVQVNVISAEPFTSGRPDSQLIDANTETQLAESSNVLTAVARTLNNGQTTAQIKRHTTVTPLTSASIFKITFTASSPTAAQVGADAIATQYLQYRSEQGAAKVQTIVDHLNDRVSTLRSELSAANRAFRLATPGSQRSLDASSQRQQISTQLDFVLSQIDTLDSIDTSGGALISSAQKNGVLVNPGQKLLLLTGGLLGLILGVIAAFVVNSLDDRIFEWRATRSAGGGELLAVVPSAKGAVPAADRDLDAFRALRERLLSTPGSVVVAIDLFKGDQPSDVGANLALAFKESVRQVRLVLAEYPREVVDHLSGVLRLRPLAPEGPAGEPAAPVVLRYASGAAPGLEVVVLGVESSGSPAVSGLAHVLHGEEHEVVSIVSLPPNATRSLRLAAARLGHWVILVAAAKATRVRTVKALSAELGAVGAVVHGGVLVPKGRHLDLEPSVTSFAAATSAEPAAAKGRDEADHTDHGERAVHHHAQTHPAPWKKKKTKSAAAGRDQRPEESDDDSSRDGSPAEVVRSD